MCGIVGLIYRDRPILVDDKANLDKVLEKLSYRGPDGRGKWNSEKVLLGHRRLSIIDLSDAGIQPFIAQEGKLVITFNGEIYNYREIRETLISHGYTFHTHTDTEVILLAYDYYGVDFLHYLRGMFAFCLFDRRKNKILLARDPAGEKPLYYYFDSQRLVFSSEIKVFHAFPEVPLSIDVESVKAFFCLQYAPGPHSVYNEIKRLPAGSMLELNLDTWEIRQQKYWSIERYLNNQLSTPEEIDFLLSESVKYRLVADVEVGLLLSGGIDSALLASYAHNIGVNLRAFTASFEKEDLDESKYARRVADQFGMEQVVINGGRLTPETFDRVIFHSDELLGDPASIPTFLLAREISRHVKVVLSGEGADELFWGYDTYRLERVWRWFSWMRTVFSRMQGFQRKVSAWEISNQVPAGLTRIGKLLSAKYDIGASNWTTIFSDHTIESLVFSNGHKNETRYLQEIEQRISQLKQVMDSFQASLSIDLLFWLTDDLLIKVDRMTMAHGVEARAPYLDPELILKALALPQKYKIHGSSGKYILRKFVENHFPGYVGKSIAWRKKHGFEVPVSLWLRENLREQVEDRLSTVSLARSGILDVTLAGKIKENFYSSRSDGPIRRKLWLLLCFQSWYEMHQTGFRFRQRP